MRLRERRRSYLPTRLRYSRPQMCKDNCMRRYGVSEAEESARARLRGWSEGGTLRAVHVQRADSNHGGRVFFKKLELR